MQSESNEENNEERRKHVTGGHAGQPMGWIGFDVFLLSRVGLGPIFFAKIAARNERSLSVIVS